MGGGARIASGVLSQNGWNENHATVTDRRYITAECSGKAWGAAPQQLARQRGSHMILVQDGHMATLSVPDHREVAKGTLRSLIRSSGLTVEEFVFLAEK